MLSYKNNQTIPPLYDYYVETDLDSLDDQPVDYSKKYSDQDSYEDCRRRGSNIKPNQFPAPEVSQTIKPNCRSSTDEVRVYCIEGTPVTISSASSFSDLRDIGAASSLQKTEVKCSFPSANEDDITQNSLEVKKSDESYDINKDESLLSKEKDELNREIKSVSFRSGDISKASSPLMFSRSSSVCSLNSFEQHSIIDDRSSVSAFSALTSGIISPSDLPDSPGEMMSPILTDKANSPKIDNCKADSDNESENIDLCKKEKMLPECTLENKSSNSPSVSPVQLPKSKDYRQMESYKSVRNSDEDDNDILTEQLEFVHDSSAENDEVFTNPEFERNSYSLKNERDSSDHLSEKSDADSDADDILLQQCIQLGMPNKSVESKCDVNVCRKLEFQALSRNIPDSQIDIRKEIVMLDKNLEPDRCDVTQHPLGSKLPEESLVQPDVNADLLPSSNKLSQCKSLPVKNDPLMTSDPIKSDDDSDGGDDDDEAMLQRCIELGMPQKPPDKIHANTEGFMKSQYSAHSVGHNLRPDMCNPASVKFDDDSDGDDILLQQCIQLGMPNKSSENEVDGHAYKRIEGHNVCSKTNVSQVVKNTYPGKSQRDPSVHDDNSHIQQCVQLRIPKEPHEKKILHSKVFSKPEFPTPSVSHCSPRAMKKMCPVKSEGDSDADEDDILLQHCIQMGMPKESWEKKKLHSRHFNKPGCPSNIVSRTPHSISLVSRNECPDGIADADEDDDMLAKCIRAGMPSPKTMCNPNNGQNRFHNPQIGNISLKLQTPNHSYLQNTTTESNKKYVHSRLPPSQPYALVHSSTTWLSRTSFIEVDSMRIYRTEDTPILSPSASISDLSSLSFNESFLNNSRNSDCSSESEDDDELLLQCIRSGMPEAKRAVA